MARTRGGQPLGWNEPFATAPSNVTGLRARTHIGWGCGGLLLGVVLTVLGLVFFAPRPTFGGVSPPPQSDITATVDDRYLTRLVSEGVTNARLPFAVRDISAHVAAGNIVTITGQAQIGGLPSAGFLAQAQVYASNNTVALRDLYGSVGGVAIISRVTDILQTSINARIAMERQLLTQGGIDYSVVGVSSADGLLTLHLTFT